MSKRLRYWLLGCTLGVVACLPLELLKGRYTFLGLVVVPVIWGNAALSIAQWKGRVKPLESPAPLTLFPRDTR